MYDSDYNIKSERNVIRNMLFDNIFLKDVVLYSDVVLGHFTDVFHRDVYKSLKEYFSKYGTRPMPKKLLLHMIPNITRVERYETLEKQKKVWISSLKRLYSNGLTDSEKNELRSDIDILEQLRKNRALKRFMVRSDALYSRGKYDEINKMITNLYSELAHTQNVISQGDIVSDYNINLSNVKIKKNGIDNVINTGLIGVYEDSDNMPHIVHLDNILYGGLRTGLTLIVGENNIGKSFALMEFGYNAARWQKKNVLLVTIEMEKEAQQFRIYSRMTGIEFSQFYTGEMTKEEYVKWDVGINKWKNEGCGIYYVLSLESATVYDIEQNMRDIEISLGIKFDFLVIDYLNDMIPKDNTRNSKDWDALGTISWDLAKLSKGWNNKRGIPVLTANQRKTNVDTKDGIKWKDAAFSPLVTQHASLGIGISQSDIDAEIDRIKWNIFKFRFGGKKNNLARKTSFYTYPKFEISLISSKKRIKEYYGR